MDRQRQYVSRHGFRPEVERGPRWLIATVAVLVVVLGVIAVIVS